MTVSQTRGERLDQLVARRDRLATQARALEALAEMIRHAEVPVTRYAQTWASVRGRLELDAAQIGRHAQQIGERIETLERAQEAADAYVPPTIGTVVVASAEYPLDSNDDWGAPV